METKGLKQRVSAHIVGVNIALTVTWLAFSALQVASILADGDERLGLHLLALVAGLVAATSAATAAVALSLNKRRGTKRVE